jgi:hypothetical protein
VITPVLPDDSVLLTLPFGGAVLQTVGISKPEIDGILEDFRERYMEDSDMFTGTFDYLTSLGKRLPPSSAEVDETVWSDFIDKENPDAANVKKQDGQPWREGETEDGMSADDRERERDVALAQNATVAAAAAAELAGAVVPLTGDANNAGANGPVKL